MLASRGFYGYSIFSKRFFAPSVVPPSPKELTKNDVDLLTNPGEEYLDGLMKWHGDERPVFKREDIYRWSDSFPEYRLRMICLKDTTRVIAVGQYCYFDALKEGEQPLFFLGLGWTDPEYRNRAVMELQASMALEERDRYPTANAASHPNKFMKRFWHIFNGLKEHEDKGHKAAAVSYKSFYDLKDMIIPENLDFSGITVKDARKVPKRDIINYDQTIHPYHREMFIISHMYDKDGFGKVAYDEDGNVIGIGQAIVYKTKKDCHISPIYADSPRVAQAMFASMLKDIRTSGTEIAHFEMRSAQQSQDCFRWIAPFLKCKPSRVHIDNLSYKYEVPEDIDFTKVYSPSQTQMFLV
ncbi:DUF1248 domain-containing protein [Caenorhabditis elegans]|uniref:DUF1248 domain-containing protein n=1 Tax=Caenorhabditis elegans TaxID=6239 RepID=H9G316_CAEEL|nr:DUF1248 domain-containing protein [Caenorhabditis elegans]CCG28284.1 DUF1248 domain-containing protein [Caenorhabditis elegans]|eukprot:NP_001256709.1 Uncharacterized protein CELE_F36D3.16 [Caenorhabditis elegans]